MEKTGFTRKKVESLTLGEKLKKLRSDFRMSLLEVSRATRIQVKYLEFLESGAYDKLPADVYVRGFLRSYARYLNIDEQAFIKLYERERNIQENLGRETSPHISRMLAPASFVISSRSLIMGAIVLLLGGAFLYIYQEFKSFAATPRLVITEPHSGATIEANEIIVLGKTDKDARVTINNQPVLVGNEGEFSDKLLLQPGLNTVTVVAVNRFNKEKTETLSLEARYPVAEAAPEKNVSTPVGEFFHLEVGSKDIPIDLSVSTDGTVIFTGTLAPREKKSFDAKEILSVSSNHGEQTTIRFNGGTETLLATRKGIAQGVVFVKTGRKE